MTADDYRYSRRASAIGGVGCVLAFLFGKFLWTPFFFLFVPAWVVAFVGMVSAYSFRCPRCERRFARTWYMSNALTSRCLHCGYSIHESTRH